VRAQTVLIQFDLRRVLAGDWRRAGLGGAGGVPDG
jgi:hypothetical protein